MANFSRVIPGGWVAGSDSTARFYATPDGGWLTVPAAGGGSFSAAYGLATETDTAFALSASLSAAFGLSTETDSALALSATLTASYGLATETDTAFALSLSSGFSAAYGTATETDTAFGLSFTLRGTYGRANETDTAFALSQAVATTSTPSANYAVQPLVPYLYLDTLYAAPSKPRAGMVVLADGTYWNPGSGAGYYGYYGASWVKLG